MKTERTRLRRAHHKACYDREVLYRLLDTVSLCHVAYVDEGQPYAMPTLQWREGDNLYWHGSSAGRAMRCCDGAPVCVTVTRVDGFVLARSAFHHSVNAQSAVILGVPHQVSDPKKKMLHFERFVEHLFKDRWKDLRPVTDQEIKATMVLEMPISEASVKIRTGPPIDDKEDMKFPVWGGIIPVSWVAGEPQPDDGNASAMPEHVKNFRFGS